MIYFIAILASSDDPGGFPAEVAWVDESGKSEAYRIKPDPGWLDTEPGSSVRTGCGGTETPDAMSCRIEPRGFAWRMMEVLGADGVTVCTGCPQRDHRLLGMILGDEDAAALSTVSSAAVFRNACDPLRSLPPGSGEPSGDARDILVRRISDDIVARAAAAESMRLRPGGHATSKALQLRDIWCGVAADVADRVKSGAVVQPDELRWAFLGDRRIRICRASPSELAAISKGDMWRAPDAALDRWTVIAIRDPGRPAALHALGWRADLLNVWITSRLTAYDFALRLVETASGHVYRLGDPDAPEIDASLSAHLRYALARWNFSDVL